MNAAHDRQSTLRQVRGSMKLPTDRRESWQEGSRRSVREFADDQRIVLPAEAK